MAHILSGKIVRDYAKDELVQKIKRLEAIPELAIILVGDNPESRVYVDQKKKFGESLCVVVHEIHVPEKSTTEDILAEIQHLNTNDAIGGIIVQLPLPAHIDRVRVLDAVVVHKDVDGLGSVSLAKLYRNEKDAVVPATTRGIMSLLEYYKISLEGKHVVVVGRSDLVGKPTALVCLSRNATVTVCHSHTRNLAEITRIADILIVACGRPKFITPEYTHPNQTVVDVGIHRTEEGICGDVDFATVSESVSAITPVPGGVGPLTVLSLFQNLIDTQKR